jgi:hypothetical protein
VATADELVVPDEVHEGVAPVEEDGFHCVLQGRVRAP